MRFFFRLIVAILKIFSPRYWITRKLSKEQEREDSKKLLDILRRKE